MMSSYWWVMNRVHTSLVCDHCAFYVYDTTQASVTLGLVMGEARH
jgi:hypothetical protein